MNQLIKIFSQVISRMQTISLILLPSYSLYTSVNFSCGWSSELNMSISDGDLKNFEVSIYRDSAKSELTLVKSAGSLGSSQDSVAGMSGWLAVSSWSFLSSGVQ